MATVPTVDGWAVLELMGHRRMAGKLTEVLVGGVTLLRIDVPRPGDGSLRTQFYGVGSVYCITPTTEEIAREVAYSVGYEPIHPWELRPRLPAAPPATDAEFEAHVFKGNGATCLTCGKCPQDGGHISQEEADELAEEAGARLEDDDQSDVHAFVASEDEDDGTCAECGELPHDPEHAHAFVQAEVGAEDACAKCEGGPDDQVHVVDEHPYEPEADSGDPCGHFGRYGRDPIHTKTDPTKDPHVFEPGQREHPELCLHCDHPEASPLHGDVGGSD